DSPRGGRRARRYCSHSRSRPRDDCPSAIALWASSGQPFTVGRVEMIEDLGGLQSGLIVAERPRLDSPEHGFEALGVGHGNATDIKEVNRVADRGERRMRVEPEAAEKHLERDPASDVGELGAVEIEAERTPETAARDVDPGEPRLLVDEAPDEPDACQAVDPEVLARHPDATAVFGRVEAAKPSLRGARLPRGKVLPYVALEGRHRVLGLALCLAREEIDRRQLLERAAQALHERIGLALSEPPPRGPRRTRPREESRVFLAAVEQLADVLDLLRGLEIELYRHREAAGGLDLGFRVGERGGPVSVNRQEIDAVAQNAATAALQRAPDP